MPHLITADKILGRFGVPTGGVNQLMPASDLPTTQLRDALNVFPRNGVLRPRPGLRFFDATVFTGTPTGMLAYYTADNVSVPVLATTTSLYAYVGGTWSDITVTPFTADASHPARFTTIVLGTPPVNYLIHTNGVDAPVQWDGVNPVIPVAGTPAPPLWTDVCTIQDHIIGIVPPYMVQWGNIRAIDAWPALNQKQAAETADPVIALRPFGQGGQAVLYKQRSYWFVNYTGSFSEASAFQFQQIGFFDGPASPAAVVDVNGSHILMTSRGRIGVFSGSSLSWVGDLCWRKIRFDLDVSRSQEIFGVYDPVFQDVTFFYPSLTTGAMTNAVLLTVPNPAVGRTDAGVFPLEISGPVTCGTTLRLADLRDRVLVTGMAANKSYEWTTDTEFDDTTPFGGFWQTGLVPTPGMDPFKLEAVEIFAERGPGYGTLWVQPVTSWTLGGEGTLGQKLIGDAGNLEKPDEPTHSATGLSIQARFFGLHCSFDAANDTTLRFKGAAFFAQRRTV